MKYIFTVFVVLLGQVSMGQVQLTADQWKAVQGIFRDYGNPDMNIRFSARGDTLFAEPLWAGKTQIALLPKSPLEFHGTGSGEGGNLQVVFKRDSSGGINELLVNGGAQWIRNNNYRPLVKKEITHTPEQVRAFAGLYQLAGGEPRYIELFERNNQFKLKQLWDGNVLDFVPDSELSFFMPGNLLFTLQFTKDAGGAVTEMVAFKRDHWKKINTVVPTLAALRHYEGKYRSKDDPDNQISIVARDSGLVVKQAWDGKEIAFAQISETFFYNDAGALSLELELGDGKVTGVRLFGNSEFTHVLH